jgi:response regulator RpfG family c-di-GMP phosphodiesterase
MSVIAHAESTAPPQAAPSAVVLCVDDEPNILSALKRTLRGDGLRVLTAGSGREALEILGSEPIDIVVADMRMPGMDGADLLEQVHARWPTSIRLLLTGHADTSAAVAAINRGRIFRYLTKPWDDAELRATVRQGLDIRHLEQERQRLEALTSQQNLDLRDANEHLERRVQERTEALSRANDTLKRNYLTGIKVFSGLIELRGGRLAGHGRRVADMARKLAQAMGRPDDELQQIFVAALLHDIGLIGLGDAVLAKSVARCDADETTQFQRHAELGEHALMPLEEMQPVAALIRAHHERFDGQGYPDRRAGDSIPLGARILAVVDVFDELQNAHLVDAPMSAQEARTVIRHGRRTQFDPEVVDVFLHITEPQRPKATAEVLLTAALLEPSMVLARDLVSPTGVLMLAAGHVLTASLIQKVQEFDQRVGGKLAIHVRPRGAS